MAYFVIDEKFSSGSESVISQWVCIAENKKEVLSRWQNYRGIEYSDTTSVITNEGNMFSLDYVAEITEKEFEILSKHLPRFWY